MERMTPGQTGILLLILLVFACVAGFLTEFIEQKREGHISELITLPGGKVPNHSAQRIAFKIGNRIVTVCMTYEGFSYHIMDQMYNDLDFGTYDDIDISTKDCGNKIIDYLKSLPANNNIRGDIDTNSIPVYINYSGVMYNKQLCGGN